MLPIVKNTATALVTALTIAAVAASPAQAGKGDFARGVATAVVIGALIGAANQGHAQPRPQPQPEPVWGHGHYNNPPPVYYEPAPRISIHDTAAAAAFNSYSRAERRAIQRSLRAQGYYYGGVDGSFGPSTYRAVAAYADDLGMARKLRSAAGAYGVYDSLLY